MANFESALKGINDSSTSYYVTPASASMSCDVLTKNQKTLVDQIAEWQGRFDNGNSKEKKNITGILANQNAKLKDYSSLVAATCGTPAATANPASTVAGQQTTDNATQPGGMVSPTQTPAIVTGVVQKAKTALSSVPMWVYEAGGAVLLLGIIIMVARRSKK